MNFDSFMRLNVRLDLIMDEIEVAKEGADLVGENTGEISWSRRMRKCRSRMRRKGRMKRSRRSRSNAASVKGMGGR